MLGRYCCCDQWRAIRRATASALGSVAEPYYFLVGPLLGSLCRAYEQSSSSVMLIWRDAGDTPAARVGGCVTRLHHKRRARRLTQPDVAEAADVCEARRSARSTSAAQNVCGPTRCPRSLQHML